VFVPKRRRKALFGQTRRHLGQFFKGKSAIAIARLCGKERNFSGEHFQARGCAVSTDVRAPSSRNWDFSWFKNFQ